MNRTAAEILEDARKLPPDDLEWLVETLLRETGGGPEAAPEEAVEAAWGEEIKRRIEEIDSGAVEMVSEEQMHATMLARLSPQARARLHQ